MASNMNEGFIVIACRTSFTFCRSDDEGEHRWFRGNSPNFAPPREEDLWMGLQPCATFAERLHRALNESRLYITSPAESCLSPVPDDSGTE